MVVATYSLQEVDFCFCKNSHWDLLVTPKFTPGFHYHEIWVFFDLDMGFKMKKGGSYGEDTYMVFLGVKKLSS